jgi:hypothetical protein
MPPPLGVEPNMEARRRGAGMWRRLLLTGAVKQGRRHSFPFQLNLTVCS